MKMRCVIKDVALMLTYNHSTWLQTSAGKFNFKEASKMEMCYDEALVMPCNYVVMEQDEMMYIDGGFYISNSTITDSLHAIGFAIRNVGVGALTSAITPLLPLAFSWINAVPVVGWTIFGIICASAAVVAGYVATAIVTGKGIDISLSGGIQIM
jgi:hypothetical protein